MATVPFSGLKVGMTFEMPHPSDVERFTNGARGRGAALLIDQQIQIEGLFGKDIKIERALPNNGFFADPYGHRGSMGSGVFLRENFFPEGQRFLVRGLTEELGRDVRNTRVMAARTNLPHGPESHVASYLTGIRGKNAAQQNDMLSEMAGVHGPAPNRKGYSGGKTRRRKNKRKTYRHSRR